MKIGQKLILGFVGIALIVAIVGYVAINSEQKITKSYCKVIDDTVPEILALKKIQIVSLRMMMEAISFVAIEDERKFAAAAAAAAAGEEEKEFLEAKEEIEKWEAEYKKRIEPDDVIERQFVKEIDTAEERIEDLGATIITLKKKGIAGEEIIEKKEELEEAEESFLELIESVIAHEKGELGEEHEIVHQGFASSRNVVFGATGLGFLLAIGLGMLIARSISNPIKKLKDAATEIGKGELNTKVEIKSKDEIGVLAACFNKMAEDLSGAMEKERNLAAAAAAADAEKKKAEELATMNEELESTNEEIRQTNEELESTTEELRLANEEAQRAKEAAEKKASELERFNKVAVGRELKMKEMKARIAELEEKLKQRS